MKKNQLNFLIVASIWLLIGAGLMAQKEFTLSTGQEVLIPVRPVDPTDLFRGSYMALNYNISSVSLNNCKGCGNTSPGGNVYVGLRVGPDKIVSPNGFFTTKPGGLYIKGKTYFNRNAFSYGVEYGIESYFFRQGDEAQITSLLRNGACAKVYIDRFGQAVLRDLVPCSSNLSANAMFEGDSQIRRQQQDVKPKAAMATSTVAEKKATSTILKK